MRGDLTPAERKRALELSQQVNADKRQIVNEMDPERRVVLATPPEMSTTDVSTLTIEHAD
jgi:hypothetical protein